MYCVKSPFVLLISAAFWAASAPLSLASDSHDYYCSLRVVGYYPDYHFSKLLLTQIRWDKLTDLIYFSISPRSDGSLDTSTINLSRQQELVAAAHARNVKVSICVGGWGLCGGYAAMAASPSARAAFIANIVNFCSVYSLDGVDLDWEPLTNSTDKTNYGLLIKELKTAMTAPNLRLTVAVAALGSEFPASTIPFIDGLHVMAYDMGTPHSSYNDAVAALEHWRTFGFDVKKIILGVPFYGRKSDWSYYAYSTIINTYHPAAAVDEIDGIYFNGAATIQRKTGYVLQQGFGGIMIWEIPEDTHDSTSLLTAIADIFHQELPPDFDCDRDVDGFDLNHFLSHFLDAGCASDNAWCAHADRDLSGIVDLADFALFASDWLP